MGGGRIVGKDPVYLISTAFSVSVILSVISFSLLSKSRKYKEINVID